MAWTDVTFGAGSLLTSTKMTQLDANFDALAAGNAGAPPLAVNSFIAAGTSSLGLSNATSGFNTAQVGSFGLVDASSGVQVGVVAPAAPAEGRLYRDAIPRAWCVASRNGTLYSDMGVDAVANPATGIYVITLSTSFRADFSWAPLGTVFDASGNIIQFDQRSQSGGSAACITIDHAGNVLSRGFTFFAVGS